MSNLLFILLFCLPFCDGGNLSLDYLTDEQRRNLETYDFEKLPAAAQNVFRDYRDVKEGDQWCCKIKAVKSIMATASQLAYHTVSQRARDSTSCGFLWLSRCNKYRTTYSTHAIYRTTYKSRMVPTTCPDNELTCCKDHVLIANSCLPVSRIPEVHKDLIGLAQEQLLG